MVCSGSRLIATDSDLQEVDSSTARLNSDSIFAPSVIDPLDESILADVRKATESMVNTLVIAGLAEALVPKP